MLFTSEQVSAGHPDKICDQIADAIVTDCLRHDRDSRVAVECMIKDCMIFIAGEITSTHAPDYEVLCREVLRRVGDPDPEAYVVNSLVTCQSRDIAMGVDRGGAGDQGLMFGYATNETPELLPLPFAVATRALELLRDRHSPLLLPDAKSQVTFDYCGRRIHTFLISAQHHAYAGQREIYELVRSVMDDVADGYGLNHDFRALVNPTGRFVRGGSYADTGVTGRKIVADTYGGVCRSGGRGALRQGPHQGGPLRRVHGAEDRLRYRAGTAGAALRSAAGLRHWDGRAHFCFRAVFRHQPRAAACDPPAHQQPLRPHARRDH